MYRKNCGCNQPCNCDMSVTTSSCGVSCPPPVMACPPVACQPGVTPTPPKITIEDLLKLIETKCDKETCKVLQFEIDYLYWLFEQNKPGGPSTGGPDIPKCPDGTYECHPPCKDGTWDCYPHNPPHFPDTKLFQLVENMVEKLSGDLTGKYPSAALFKKELLALWKCMANKQQHHGDWKDNWSYRNIQQLPDGYNCLLDGGKDPAPGKIKVITPVDVGSTVFHEITNDKNVTKRCLFESLVDNNIVEPSMASVLDGKWINYCDIKEVIDCVLPRVKITDCKQACDDPNGDGVHEGKSLCDCVVCDVVDTNTVDLTKTKLLPSKDNPLGRGNSIKADVIIDPKAGNIITANANGLYATAPTDNYVTKFELVGGKYKITMKDGKVLTAACCASDKVSITSDSKTFQAETKPGGVDHSKFVRAGSLTVPAGTPRSLYQVNSSNAAYAMFGPTTAALGSVSGPHDVSSAYMGYRIMVNGVVKGRQAWANDEDVIYKGDTTDMVAHMSEQMVLNGGDVLTMEVEYGDHSSGPSGMEPIGHIDFHANSAYIDVLQIKTI